MKVSKSVLVPTVTTLFLTGKRSIDEYTTEKTILLFQPEHVLRIWFTYCHPVTMEGDGLVLCQALDTTTLNWLRT